MSQDKPVRSVNLTLLPSLAFLVFGVALALAFVIASDKVGKSIGQFKQNRPEIIVKGVATLDVRSGQGSMNGTLSWRGENFAEGRFAMLAQRAAVQKLLKEAGFAESEIVFSASEFTRLEPAVFPEFAPNQDGVRTPIQRAPVDFNRFARGKVPEFALTQSFSIETPNVDRILAFSRQEIFLEQGVTLSRGTPIFRLVKLNESKQELLEAAAKDAQRRAATMVAGSGSKVGALLDASQGVIQICAKDRVGESDANSIDFYSIEKTIRVVVTMRFEIVKE
ncbi:MAG: hypothetical protein RL492_177 [Verrucomicrobiota bacterium]|jgi:hypothetical protein